MTDDLSRAKETLKDGDNTLVLCLNDRMHVSTERGIKPLLAAVNADEDWRGACAADKIVGKAAAMLYVLLDVRAVYAEVMSNRAKDILGRYHIEACCDTLTEQIVNRQGTGLCPMEEAVRAIDDPRSVPTALKRKIDEMKNM